MVDSSPNHATSLGSLIGLGAGGHARVLIDLIHQCNGNIVGLLVAPDHRTDEFEGLPILGSDEKLPELKKSGIEHAFIGVGTTRASKLRQKLQQLCEKSGFVLPPLVHPTAIIGANVEVNAGCQLLAGSIVNPNTKLGDGCLLNTGAIIEHDCVLGPFVHCGPGSVLGGDVIIGARSHIGLGARILQGITIGRDVTVGAGAVVIRDVPDGACVVGVPAQPIKEKS